MGTKLKDKDPLAFIKSLTPAQIQDLIRIAVAELKPDIALLEADRRACVQDTFKKPDRILEQRVAFWEGVQDRLWSWYRMVTGGEAERPGDQG